MAMDKASKLDASLTIVAVIIPVNNKIMPSAAASPTVQPLLE